MPRNLIPNRMGYLVLRICTDRDGKNVLVRFPAVRHRFIQPSFQTVVSVAAKNGYEIRLGPDPSGEQWPLWLHGYTSPNKDGVGRAGSQFFYYRAARSCRRSVDE